MDIEQHLDENDVLSQIHRQYRLIRGDMPLYIEISEILTGPEKGVFLAAPRRFFGGGILEYVGRGNSIENALQDCLTKIKGLNVEQILTPLT